MGKKATEKDTALALAQQMEVLFEHGKERGIPVTYRAIAEATGESANNVYRIYSGQNQNPGIKTLMAILEYFETDIGYFKCRTREECLAYLAQTVPQKNLDKLAMRAQGLSPEAMKEVGRFIDLARRAEGLEDTEAKSKR